MERNEKQKKHLQAATVILLIQPSHFPILILPIPHSYPPVVALSEQKHAPLLTPLQPGINLIHHIMTRIIRPRHTSLLHTIRQHALLQLGHLLNRINIQSSANMPRDMAMERPHARIVRLVL